jgi:hypothetical protein
MYEERSPGIWHRLLNERLSRRSMIAAAAGAGAAMLLPMRLERVEGAVPARRGAPRLQPPFEPIRPTSADELVLPRGYRFDVLRMYGDEIGPGLPYGYNNDFVAYFPMDLLQGGSSARDGLLWVNHENPSPLFLHGNTRGRKTPEQLQIERTSVGGSIFRVTRDDDGRWAFRDDAHNRRVTADTPCELTGPAAGSDAVSGARTVIGSVANCSGGMTPWGTALSCEENYQDYAMQPPPEGAGYGWGLDFPETHHGWVVEHDVFDPHSTPRKHTAMGRFHHENVALTVAPSGRVVGYMGDDKRDCCVYKFVSEGVYVPGDRAANMRLLEAGRLYAADFGDGRWILLDHATQPRLREVREGRRTFHNQGDVLTFAHDAAIRLGATPVDRPEDLEVHPHTGHVYISLTNNSLHGNYHGQIVRIMEMGDDPEAEEFRWDFFAVGGPQSGFSSPDNLVFDVYGNLWMATDVSGGSLNEGIHAFLGNNSFFFFATEGPQAGRAYQFASGPNGCELCGPWFTPDGTTMFLSVQHPGAGTRALANPTSHWPRGGDSLPRPAVVAITGFPGWRQ